MHPRQQLCTSFALQAAHTWSFLARGDRYKLLPGEETITDVNLLGLKEAKPSLVYTDKYTRYREGKVTGADWEWWIADSRGWLGLRIQAKKLDPQTGRYLDLEGDVQKATAQADRLVHDALVGSDRLYPVYCFYNCTSEEVPQPRCPTGLADPRVFGCALAAAPIVRALIAARRTSFSDIAPYCIPWSCLFCDDHPDGVRPRLTAGGQAVLDRLLFSDYEVFRGGLMDEPPEHVEAAWRIDEQLSPDEIDLEQVPDLSMSRNP